MSDTTLLSRRTGRIGALCLLLLAAVYGIGGSVIEYAFASDPLGPRVFPVLLAVALAILCAFYLRNPGEAESFPHGRTLVRILAIPVTLVTAALLLEVVGFPIAVFSVVTIIGALFGARPLFAVIGGVSQAALWWFVFAYLLEVYLPVGSIFG